jgi:hypothetical protein
MELPIIQFERNGQTLSLWVMDPQRNLIKAPGRIIISGITNGLDLNGKPLLIKSNKNDYGLQKVNLDMGSYGTSFKDSVKGLYLENAKISRLGGPVNLPPAESETQPQTYSDPEYQEEDQSSIQPDNIFGIPKNVAVFGGIIIAAIIIYTLRK